MSEHSDNIRQGASHAAREDHSNWAKRLLAAADYLDVLDARHHVLLNAAIGARNLIGIYLPTLEACNKQFTTEVYDELTAAVKACEKGK